MSNDYPAAIAISAIAISLSIAVSFSYTAKYNAIQQSDPITACFVTASTSDERSECTKLLKDLE